jgi:hypothetical protein
MWEDSQQSEDLGGLLNRIVSSYVYRPNKQKHTVSSDESGSQPMRPQYQGQIRTCRAARVFAELRLPSAPKHRRQRVRTELAG